MLFSGLVFPGLGQWTLGERKKGGLIMAALILLVLVLAVRVFLVVYHGLLPEGGLSQVRLGPEEIADIHHRAWLENWWLMVLIGGIWLGSIWDAWRTGKKFEAENEKRR